ncbi:hypothetical protein FIBSPDRAFT_948772 [Athelia psychrophila]|uniref:YWTD domain-containing protein n=1 Tax=Athelia psychrophila TaxID=1759441 RepID=A0A166QG67_9AGAM|nr:hypothetical protein FIBSPDRAFT_948772 [Fibularhizoctonia sp. CBS 109695]
MSTPKHEHAGRLIILDLGAGLVDTRPGKGQIYVTCMGHSTATNDGHLVRAAGDGTGVEVIVPDGAMFTPKQLIIDTTSERLYRADREGVRVIRRTLDGSDVETLVCNGETDEGRKDAMRHCVGLSIDTTRGLLYRTQKVRRLQGPTGPHPPRQHRHPRRPNPRLTHGYPDPLRIELDNSTQTLYWTDRGDPPLGNTLNHADVSSPLEPNTNVTNDTASAKGPSKDTVVAGKFHEVIGLSLGLPGCRTFVADLNGSVYAVDLDSGRKEVLIEDAGTVTGIVYCEA